MVLASSWLTGRWSLHCSANVLHKVATCFLLLHRTDHAQQQVQFLEIEVMCVVQRKRPLSQPPSERCLAFRKRVRFTGRTIGIFLVVFKKSSALNTLVCDNVMTDLCTIHLCRLVQEYLNQELCKFLCFLTLYLKYTVNNFACDVKWWWLSNQLERRWHTKTVAQFEVLLLYLAGWIEESHQKCSQPPCQTHSANLHCRKGSLCAYTKFQLSEISRVICRMCI
jgi:hypothetical protein